MSAGPFLVALGASAVAALSAAADGALLGRDPAAQGDDRRALALYEDRETVHRTLSFARILMQLGAGASLAWALRLEGRHDVQAALLAAAVGVILVGITESAARAWGDARGPALLASLSPVVRVLRRVLAPAVVLGAKADALMYRLVPPRPVGEAEREATAEQFREVIAAEAEVSPREEALLAGVFTLGDTEVREVMVPRVDIVGVERTMPWSEVVDRVRSSEHARFPVYEDTLDEMVGILYAKDLLPAIIADEPPDAGWAALVRPAEFIPGTKTIDQQLRDFKASRTHIAIVVDEYGGTAGLVTIEDILEEIVGEIRDEYDVEEPDVESEGGRCFWVSGRLTLGELSEVLGEDFESEDVTTVGGLVYERLGRVPRSGESLTMRGWRVVVERVRRRRIERVYFERAVPEARPAQVLDGEGEE